MKFVTVLFVALFATVAFAGPSVVGDMNGWDPADAASELALNANGIWELTLSLTAGTYGYKITETDAWDGNDFPGNNQVINLAVDSSVTILANLGATVGVKEGDEFVMHQTPIVTGDFISQMGGADWDPAEVTGELFDNGDGTFSFVAGPLAAGAYQFKVTFNGNWDQDTVGFGTNNVFCVNESEVFVFDYDFSTNEYFYTDCSGVIDNENASWGSIKSLYR
ncbi:hypothetical protein HN388_02860 [bacterium]|jgi:hypothetical protein|nr:hypothetical protein [bacterium]MBT4291567.1 hypothetical protein [bacterium]MBT7310220.1 hypothetical protein [bacterium]